MRTSFNFEVYWILQAVRSWLRRRHRFILSPGKEGAVCVLTFSGLHAARKYWTLKHRFTSSPVLTSELNLHIWNANSQSFARAKSEAKMATQGENFGRQF